jgi:hypothetical protein
MIIDTEKLKTAVQCRDDNVDWEKCSMSSLNYMEKRCLHSLGLIENVENLYTQLIIGTAENISQQSSCKNSSTV